MNDKEIFAELLKKPIDEIYKPEGIGTLGEKYLHALLKKFCEPNTLCHEVKVGRYTADVCVGTQIFEVQTRSMTPLKPKLEYYLEEGYKVTVVHPIARQKHIVCCDPESGELSKPKKSPKKGQFCHALTNLASIKYFLDWENLSVKLLLLDVTEYRNQNGYGKSRKKRSTRLDTIPTELVEVVELNSPSDYLKILPPLPKVFSAKEFAKACKASEFQSRIALGTLRYLEVVKEAGKEGKKILYTLGDAYEN